VRAGLVQALETLDRYPWGGHSRLMGRTTSAWQDTATVLAPFGRRVGVARQRYRALLAEGVARGRRPELTGGGLVRSAGGWTGLRALRGRGARLKGDERILGESDFVDEVLQAAQEQQDRRDRLRGQGYDFGKLVRRAAEFFDLTPADVLTPSKQPRRVQARSLLCYWAIRDLRLSGTAVAARLGVTQPAVSRAVRRGERLAAGRGHRPANERIS